MISFVTDANSKLCLHASESYHEVLVVGTRCFAFKNEPETSWFRARDACKANGMELARIDEYVPFSVNNILI